MKEYAKGFYNSKAWRDTQRAYMQSQNYVCERCGRPAVIVHHKTYISKKNINDPNITLNWDNLEALCQTCHQHEHFKESGVTAEGLMFDDKGNIVKI
jgi:5-methylcytosine-specific restriction endonuclease McrA